MYFSGFRGLLSNFFVLGWCMAQFILLRNMISVGGCGMSVVVKVITN